MSSARPATFVAALVLTLSGGTLAPQGATLEDFGYQSMRINGRLALGQRPLLVVRTDVAGDDNTTHPMSYYDNLVFNYFAYPSAAGYMLVNSATRFSMTRAGTGVLDLVNNVDFTPEERATLENEEAKAGHSINAAARGGFNFAAFDANGDGYVMSDELLVLVVENHNFGDSGAARWANPSGAFTQFMIEGTSTYFSGSICLVSQNVSFATLCHELSHVLGTGDVYGDAALSTRYTLMGATQTYPNNPDTYHLDPWHKLRLGWCEPRIVDMTLGGIVSLPGSASGEADKQVILHDPQRGPSEYFIIEYRTAVVGTYDDQVRDTGLVIWHVQQDAAHELIKLDSTPGVEGGEYVTMWAETTPDLNQGGRNSPNPEAWHSGVTTPSLKWNDGALTTTTLHVLPFAPGATTIDVEILSTRDTWVDFAYQPPPAGNGSFGSPFNTTAGGVAAAGWGGTILFKPGSTTQGAVINKRLMLKAPLGPVILGHP